MTYFVPRNLIPYPYTFLGAYFWTDGRIWTCNMSKWGYFGVLSPMSMVPASYLYSITKNDVFLRFLPRNLVPKTFLGQGANFWTDGRILKSNISKWGYFGVLSPMSMVLASYFHSITKNEVFLRFFPRNLVPNTSLGQGAKLRPKHSRRVGDLNLRPKHLTNSWEFTA